MGPLLFPRKHPAKTRRCALVYPYTTPLFGFLGTFRGVK